MKILLWAPFGAGKHYWGPGQSAYNLYSKNKSDDIELYLAHGYKKQELYETYKEQFYISDLKSKNKPSLIKFLLRSKIWINKNWQNFDVIHVLSDTHPSFLPAIWFKKKGVKTFIKVTIENTNLVSNSLLSKFIGLHKFMQIHKNYFDGYIAISERIKKELIKIGVKAKKIHLITNGVDTNRFQPVDKEKKIKLRNLLCLKGDFIVVFTGSVTTRKNPSLIVEAFRYFKKNSGIHLLIIGPNRVDDRERDKIDFLIKKFQLSNVTILPFQNNIEDYYKASDLFVLPSNNEGLSNSLLEAQSTGLPALVTKISGSEDLIKHGKNGFFIKKKPYDIFEKIKMLKERKNLLKAMSIQSRQLIIKKYDSKSIFERHIELFKEL